MLKRIVLLMLGGLPIVLASPGGKEFYSQISNDTAIYQNLREIKITQVQAIDLDSGIERLSAQEKMHRRPLPMRISSPMERVMKTPYRSSPKEKSSRFKQNTSGSDRH